jgi:radical SAM protein with 4Fe4S-binding SPASM domain
MEYVERISQTAVKHWPGQDLPLNRLDIELTERCNNNCIHCCINRPAGDKQALAGEMTTAEVQRILEEAVELGALHVRFTGGEPLLRPDFEELYIYARRLGLKVLLFTNGRLITPSLAKLFARIPPLIPIEITVYGMHQESYEAVSQANGSFSQYLRGIQLLIRHKVPFMVKSVLLPPNRHEMAEFEKWSSQITGIQEPPGYALFLEPRARRDDLKKNQKIFELRLSPEDSLAILTRNADHFRRETARFCRKFLQEPDDLLFFCGAGKSPCVDPYGRIQPCLGLRAPELSYDLRNGSLRQSLENLFSHLKELRATNPDYLHRCARCFLRGLCDQCPAKSWSEYGSLDTPVEYLCQATHAQARWLGLIEPGEYAWEVHHWEPRIAHL